MRTCSVGGCERKHEAHGYCRLHYRRVNTHGDTTARKPGKPYMGRTAEQVRAVIAARVKVTPSGCHEYQRALTAQGYGALSWKGIHGTHRVAYTVFVGPIPEGHHVCHSCDNPPCCNPSHLFAGTAADNNADMTAKGRANRVSWPRRAGGAHPQAQLTDEQAAAIRASAARGVDLAREYGVSQQVVCNIRNGRAYRGTVVATAGTEL